MKRSILVFIFSLLLGMSCMGDKVYLQLNIQPGDVFKSRTTVEQHIKEIIENNNLEMDQVIIFDYGYQVLEINDQGNVAIQVTYEGIGFIQDGPMGHFEYKSWEDNEEIPALARGFASVLGQSFTMTVSSRMKIVALEGLDEMVDRMIDNLDIPEGMSREQMKENFQSQFGDESMKETMGQMFAFYPKLPVRKGDTWYNELDLEKGFPMHIETQYELTDISDEEIRLKTVASITPSLHPGEMQFGTIMMHYNLRGQQNGYVIIDRESGWLKLIELEQDFEGQVQISDPSGTPYFRFPLSVSGKVKTELIK